MEKFKFVVVVLVIHYFNQCVSNEVNFCETNARCRRSVPYIISVGDCDPSKVKIIWADDIHGNEENEEDMVQAPSNVEDIAERVMESRKSLYGLLTKVLGHFQTRADDAVEKARKMIEEQK